MNIYAKKKGKAYKPRLCGGFSLFLYLCQYVNLTQHNHKHCITKLCNRT